jgi:hypothetical protein
LCLPTHIPSSKTRPSDSDPPPIARGPPREQILPMDT